MSDIEKEYIIKLYREGDSIRKIAEKLNTYPNKILRNLTKWGEPLRDKSEAQKVALSTGRSKPPLLGKKRTEEDKQNISAARAKAWKKMSDDDREKFREGARERWNNMSEADKHELQSKAGEALRKASIMGSKAERFLYLELKKLGYDPELHKSNIFPGQNYEIDLFIGSLNVIIEIDGPQHFLPLFGEERLNKTIEFDAIKNGLLITKGFCVIRIKYMVKHISRKIKQDLLSLVKEELEKIKNNFPDKAHRLIELEIV